MLLPAAENAHQRRVETLGHLLVCQDDGVAAGAGMHAVEQPERFGDQAGIEILLKRQRLLEQRVGVEQRILALRHAKTPEVGARRTVLLHVEPGV